MDKTFIVAQKNELPSLGRKSPAEEAGDRFPPHKRHKSEVDQVKEQMVELDMKFTDQIREVNNTLLSIATHLQGLQEPQPEPEPEPSKQWMPEHSNMLLWDKDENGISWNNHYKGSKIFLVCGGPSLNDTDLSLLDTRGVMSMSLNNSWIKAKPDLWIGFDAPGRFDDGGWRDPSIMKIVPWQWRNSPLNAWKDNKLQDTGLTPKDMPNCWFLSNTTNFDLNTWFTSKEVSYGGKVPGLEPEGGFHVTMIGALRVLYYLGFQEVYLLGCDWEMNSDMGKEPYAWEENRNKNLREKNNDMYRWVEGVFKTLQPGFDRANFQIYNCNRNSKLTSFPFIQYEDAIERCSVSMNSRTRGWYDMPNDQEKK
tara:strand:+ start:2244 stop:3341 length:1098 start_codon:yes stop_codon:yes gene_type:complete